MSQIPQLINSSIPASNCVFSSGYRKLSLITIISIYGNIFNFFNGGVKWWVPSFSEIGVRAVQNGWGKETTQPSVLRILTCF